MAKRNSIFHDENTRKKIQTSQIINRLQKHIDNNEEKEIMSTSQVNAAIALLKKTLPDLKQVEITGDPDHPLVIIKDLTGE